MASINKLTDLSFRNIKPSELEQVLSDGGGLYVRIRPINDGGSISFRLAYRIEGKQKWLTVGTYPTMKLKEAREARDKHKQSLSDGVDPSLAKQLEKKRQQNIQLAEQAENAKQSARMTVNKLFERWVKLDISIRRKDQGKDITRIFEKDVLPLIGEMHVEEVRKGHIATVLDTLLARNVPRLAKMALTLMRQMFRFAQDRDIIDNDPTSSIRKAQIGGKEVVRDRHLSEAEIKSLNAQLPDARLIKTTECAIWIILSTGCRIGELCKAKWEHLNLDTGVWKIPSENSKNGKPHAIYLSEFAKKQFQTLIIQKKSEIWIYPNTDNTSHVCEKSITKQISDRQLSEGKDRLSGRSKQGKALILEGGKWTPHDLRRTGATTMGNLGVRPDVIELCLNHVEQNQMKRTYQHQKLISERMEAWNLLGDRLELLTSVIDENILIGNFSVAA
ncbi:MAG: tyrosine-type recombinase/integrase [Pseudomonadota bacterium]